MKVVILAGGLGTRISEETQLRPKPMVEIGERPILLHVMQIYAKHGLDDFVIALGYKGEVIKEYFTNYSLRNSDLDVNLATGKIEFQSRAAVGWRVQLIDTGQKTMTGGRIRRLQPHLSGEGPFMATYGDGLADIDIGRLLAFHRAHGRIATVTAVRPPARFGAITFDGDRVVSFKEKPQASEGWINGGFFVFETNVFSYLLDDNSILEQAPLEKLAADGQLMAYRHEGFWHAMDTVRDRDVLNQMWREGGAPWSKFGGQ